MPESSADFDFPAGSRVAGYRLDEPVGRSATSVVFRAFDEARGEPVAVQLIVPELAADEAFRDRFVRATLAAGRVDEPHIIPIFAVGQAAGVLYVAMRYVSGGDAGSLGQQQGPLPASRVVQLIGAAAAALDAAHAAGIVHGGVRPSAMLLDELPDGDEHLYLADFGLASAAISTIATGHLPLILDYAAPEQILRRRVDGRADQYALACSAVQLLSGVAPAATADPDSAAQPDPAVQPEAVDTESAGTDAEHTGPEDTDVQDTDAQDTDAEDSARRPVLVGPLAAPTGRLADRVLDFPTAVYAVLSQALATAPGDRYPSCGEFAAALRTAFEASAAIARAPASPARGAGQGRTAGRSRTPIPAATPPNGIPVAATVPSPALVPVAAPLPEAPIWTAPNSTAPAPTAAVPTATAPVEAVPAAPTAGRPTASSRPVAAATAGGQAGHSAGPGKRGGNSRRRGVPVAIAAVVILAGGGTAAGLVLTRPSAPRTAALRAPSSRAESSGRGESSATNARTQASTAPATPVRTSSPSPEPSSTPRPARSPGGRASITRSFADPGGGSGQVDSVAVSPDGRMLVTGDANGAALLWAAGTGRLIATLSPATTAKIFAVAFSPDAALVAAGTSDGRTFVWSTATGRLVSAAADADGRQVDAVAFSPDGSMLATGDGNGQVFLWKVSDAGRRVTLGRTLSDPLGQGIWSVAFSPDGATLAAGDYQGTTCLWLLASRSGPVLLAGPSGQSTATAVAISPDGSTLATGYLNGSVSLWKLATHVDPRAHKVITEPAGVWGTAFSAHGLLAIATGNGSTYLVDSVTGAAKGTLTDPATGSQGVGAVAFLPDGESLIAGDTNGTTYLWRL